VFWALELVRDRTTREPLVPYNATGAEPRRWPSSPPPASGPACGRSRTSTHPRRTAVHDERAGGPGRDRDPGRGAGGGGPVHHRV